MINYHSRILRKTLLSMKNIDIEYNNWCERIAKERDISELTSHLREHVCEHYKRYNNRESEDSFKYWIIGILNFMHILEKKFPNITKEDKLYKLCTYFRDHQEGPMAPFDIYEFINKYKDNISKK